MDNDPIQGSMLNKHRWHVICYTFIVVPAVAATHWQGFTIDIHSISYVGVLTVGVITISKTGLARGHSPLVAFESSLIEVAELHLEEIVVESIQCENQFYALPDGG